MDRTKKYLITAFISVLIIVAIISMLVMILLKDKPTILQGQIEATEIRISGKLPGRIDTFLVKEGQNVSAGDTLVIINSPEARAKYEQVIEKVRFFPFCYIGKMCREYHMPIINLSRQRHIDNKQVKRLFVLLTTLLRHLLLLLR